MKVDEIHVPKVFVPIRILLETKEEVNQFLDILHTSVHTQVPFRCALREKVEHFLGLQK